MNKGGYPSFTNLLFALPLSGRFLPPEIMFAFHSMATPMNYNTIMQTTKGLPVADAREQFCASALHHNCKYVFFLDEDVACPPQTIPELIYKAEQNPDIAVVGGVYCLKREPPEPLIFMGNGNGPYWDWKAGEFFECSGLGMGCTLIRVECLKDLKKPWFKTIHDYSRMLDFGVPALESWTEDLFFCKRVTDTKRWKVFCDTSIICKHYDLSSGKAYSLPPDCKPLRGKSIKHNEKKILDIGSLLCENGHYFTNEGSVVTCDYEDVHNEIPSDYRCDLSKLPFGNESFDIVFSPALEYFKPINTISVINEWKRILKVGGELRLVVENCDRLIDLIKEKSENLNRLFYGNLNRIRSNAFTLENLKSLLVECGFNEKNIKNVQSDIAHIAVRVIK